MPSLGESTERGNRYIRQTRNDPNDVNFRARRHFGGSVAPSGVCLAAVGGLFASRRRR